MTQQHASSEDAPDRFVEQKISRRDFIKQLAMAGLSSTAIGSLLSACGSPNAGGTTASTSAAGSSASSASPTTSAAGASNAGPAAGRIDFVTFYTGPDGAIMQGIVDRYNQSQNGAKVNFQAPAWGADYLTKLQTSALAGNPPAAVALHNYEIPPLAKYLYEIDPAALGIDKANYVDVAWQLPMYQGKLLGLTMSTGTMGLYYNKDHFKEAGLDPEKPPTNAEEFIAAAQALTHDGRWGFARENAGWMPWYSMNWQNGGELLSEDGKKALFNTPAAIEAAQLEQDLVQKYKAELPEMSNDMMSLFFSGKVSMVSIGPWELSAVIKSNRENNTNFGWAKFPAFFDKEKAVISTSHIYSLMKANPDNQQSHDEAAKFITWLVKEGALSWAQAQAPANTAVLDQMKTSDDPVVQGMTMWVEQAAYARFPPYHPRWGEVNRNLQAAMQLIVFQGADVKATLDQLTAEADQILQRG